MSDRRELRRQADAAFRTGRFDAAERLYRALLEHEGNHRHAVSRLGALSLWSNKLTLAKYYLERALSDRRWHSRILPAPELHYNLGLTHLRSGDCRQAADAFRNASKPVAAGPLKHFAALARHAASFGVEQPYRLSGAMHTSIPFVVSDPLPVVQVSVNGSAPINVVIDTGGEGLFLDETLAQALRIKVVADIRASGIGLNTARVGLGVADRTTLGDISIRNVPVILWDMRAVDESVFPNATVGGVLGTGLLMQFLCTIDYAGGRLILRRTDKAFENLERGLPLDADYSAPMWLVATHLIFTVGSIDRSEGGLLLVDTGLAGTGAMLSASVAKAAGIPIDWSQAKPGEGLGGSVDMLEIAIPRVTLGDASTSISRWDVPGVVVRRDLPLLQGQLGFNVAGLVSHAFFRDSALTLDFDNMRIIVHKGSPSV